MILAVFFILMVNSCSRSNTMQNDQDNDSKYISDISSENTVDFLEDEFDFKFTSTETDDGVKYSGTTGNLFQLFRIEIYSADDRIKSITAVVHILEYDKNIKEEIEDFFGFIAILADKNLNQESAGEWVVQNAHNHGAKINMGGIWFSIDRQYSSSLSISIEEPEIEPLSEERIAEIEAEEAELMEREELVANNYEGKIVFSTIDVDKYVSDDYIEKENGYDYFALKVRMTNNTNSEFELGIGWMLFAQDGHIYGTSEETYNLKKPALEGKILTGETKEGWLTFKTRNFSLEPLRFDGELRPLF
jgi:hypothetical protein